MICDYVNFTAEKVGIPFISKCPIQSPASISYNFNEWAVLFFLCAMPFIVYFVLNEQVRKNKDNTRKEVNHCGQVRSGAAKTSSEALTGNIKTTNNLEDSDGS